MGASLCCLLPFALIATGLGGAWVSQLMRVEPYQPYLVAIAAAAFLFAGRKLFFSIPMADACCEAEVNDRAIWIFWGCIALAAVLVSSEYWILLLA